jgi:hypothetical protein
MSLNRKLIWLFFILLLSDGILRKWVFPSFSTPIMIIKQIVGISLVVKGYHENMIKSYWGQFSVILGFVGFFLALFFGHQNVLVSFWGGMNWWFGIPLVIIIEKTLLKRDILIMLRIIIYYTIFNSIATALQFFSPITSLLNRQIGNEIVTAEFDQVSELGGMFRCSGLFGYISQSSSFAPLSLGVILFFLMWQNSLLEKYRIPNTVIFTAFLTFIGSCIFSVSRSTIFYSLFTVGFFLYALIVNKGNFKLLYVCIFFLVIGLSFLLIIPKFANSLNTISNRFENASEGSSNQKNTLNGNAEDIFNRGILYTIDGIINPKTLDGREIPFWGYGQGMSTQVGGQILGLKSNIVAGFSLAEWDSKRYINESGVLVGLLMIICRLGFVISKFQLVLLNLKSGNSLPFLLYPSFFISFYIINQWGNSYHFNLSLFIGGLCLASIKILSINIKLLKT